MINRRERHEGVERNRRRKRDMVGRPGEDRGKGVRLRVRKWESAILEPATKDQRERRSRAARAERGGEGGW